MKWLGSALILVLGCQAAPRGVPGASSGVTREFSGQAEIGCAMCVYKMAGVEDCRLAVRIDGQAYLVEGSGIDDHGDAHAADGLCNVSRQADVNGSFRDGRFMAQTIATRH